MRIFLLGFMGSGKSFVGRPLARRLGYPFVDLDEQIEKQSGTPIPMIFQQWGEAHFRKLEQEALLQTASYSDVVVSTGGGTPCFHNNLEWINQQGLSFFLNVPETVLADRLWEENGDRPLLKGFHSKEDLQGFIHSKLDERLPYYEAAHISLDAGIDVEVLLERLEKTWMNITGH